MNLIHYRNLVGVSHTLDQAKLLAETIELEDGPNDKGEMYTRQGRLSDHLKKPYPNDEFARNVNKGALPPDLSLIIKARPNGENYIFSLLTGYRQPPAGIHLREGLYYNPYFPGAAISMPPPLTDGQVEYEDGTAATVSQMAKDVTAYLCWASEPEHDRRKRMGCQTMLALGVLFVFGAWYKRFVWSIHKTRRISWMDYKWTHLWKK